MPAGTGARAPGRALLSRRLAPNYGQGARSKPIESVGHEKSHPLGRLWPAAHRGNGAQPARARSGWLLFSRTTIGRCPTRIRRLLALVLFRCYQGSLASLDFPSPNQIPCLSTSSERCCPFTGQVASRAFGEHQKSHTGHTIASTGTAVKMPFWHGDHPGPSRHHPAPEKCHYFGRYLYYPQ